MDVYIYIIYMDMICGYDIYIYIYGNTRKRCKICSNLTIKTSEQRQ